MKNTRTNKLIYCQIREKHFPLLDIKGLPTEETRRIELINYLLSKGYPKEDFKLEYFIKRSFGLLGRNNIKILADIALVKNEQPYLIAEVKKQQATSEKHKEAPADQVIDFQLKPALNFTGATTGIFWDGTPEASIILKKENGQINKYKIF